MAEGRSTSTQPPPSPDSIHSVNPDVFSDDYALDPLDSTNNQHIIFADHGGSDDVGSLPYGLGTPQRSLSFQRAFESPTGSLRRSRGSQRSHGVNSISSRPDDHLAQTFGPHRSVSSASDFGNSSLTPHRSIRSISTFGNPRAQSPYQGATGPSHPYGMYPQDIGVARTPSAATTSTIRRTERSYSGPNGPTQPYAMYPQHTVPEDDQDDVAGMPLAIPAGFPGLGRNYRRRLGPDGEDVDDLIGPDGYAEQLPPYSRYANGVPPKYSSGTEGARRSGPQIPREDSQETLNDSPTSSNTRDEAIITNPFSDTATETNSRNETTVLPKDEGGNFKERIRERTRRKVCCGILPCWLLGVIVLAIVIAVFLGGIVGGVLAHDHGEEKGRQEAPSTITVAGAAVAAPTTTINTSDAPDAAPLSSTPSNLPSLPTGSYSVLLNNPSSANHDCLKNNSQSEAWDCTTGAELNIEITMSVNPQSSPQISMDYPTSPNAPITYGAQPPQLNQPSPLILMENRDDPTKGPAYLFVQLYNKTVILRENELSSGYPRLRRSLLDRWFNNEEVVDEPARLRERDASVAQPPDRPWFCFWNNTVLEGFIFLTQSADTSSSLSTTSSSMTTINQVHSQTTREAYTKSTSKAGSQGLSQPTASQAKRQSLPSLLPYPKMMKIEERRGQYNPVQPYCQQMQVLYNGQLNEVRDPTTNKLVIVNLTESEPPLQHQAQQGPGVVGGPSMLGPLNPAATTGVLERRRLHSKRQSILPCQCEWMSGT